jgi:hypothetical protein
MPWVSSAKFDYALRAATGMRAATHLYYQFMNVPQGQYLGFPTASAAPPDLFAPNRVDVSTLSFGAAVSMRATTISRLRSAFDHGRSKIALVQRRQCAPSSSTESGRPVQHRSRAA